MNSALSCTNVGIKIISDGATCFTARRNAGRQPTRRSDNIAKLLKWRAYENTAIKVGPYKRRRRVYKLFETLVYTVALRWRLSGVAALYRYSATWYIARHWRSLGGTARYVPATHRARALHAMTACTSGQFIDNIQRMIAFKIIRFLIRLEGVSIG